MFDTSVCSINCSGLEFFGSAVDFDDLAFMNLVSFMEEANAALSDKMRVIRELNEKKKELMEKIKILNDAIEKSNAKNDRDDVNVYGDLENPGRFAEREEGAQIRKPGEKDTISPINRKFDLIEVKNQIEEFRGQLEELNTSSQVMMIDLQRLMNKRNEAVQLVSNIEAKSHQTAQAIIANLK